MEWLLQDDFAAFLASYQLLVRQGLRLNTGKGDLTALLPLLPWSLEPIPWCPGGFLVESGARPGRHPFHAAGLYYLQEPSAMAVAECLDVQPGQLVLDCSASPGGKATHLANLLHGTGVLVANDPVSSRIKPLGENLERWGVRNAVLTNAAIPALAAAWPGLFDRVLVDAPCSGEGLFRKTPAARAEWSEEHVQGCAIRQERLLGDAALLVRPGGKLVYSTCTFAPEENEHQICRFMARHPGWELQEIARVPGLDTGEPAWVGESCAADVRRMVRIWPHRSPGEGHAIALLQSPEQGSARNTALPVRRRGRAVEPERVSRESRESWGAFRDAFLPGFRAEDNLEPRGDQLFLVPPGAPDPAGLRVVRPGLPLGSCRPGRFEPSHALALAAGAVDAAISHALSGDEVIHYLQGSPVAAAGPAGWVLMTIAGFPLGWGKRSQNIIKNHYPRGLRW